MIRLISRRASKTRAEGMISTAQVLQRAATMGRSLYAFAPSGSILLRRTTFTPARALSAGLSRRAGPLFLPSTGPARPWPLGRYCTVVAPQPTDPLAVEQPSGHLSTVPTTLSNGVVPAVEPEFLDDGVLASLPIVTKDVESEAGGELKADAIPQPKGMGPPVTSFRISKPTVDLLAKNGITHVTEVQAGTFDLLYDGSDVIAKSRTGTGKTLAFALPILERLGKLRQEQGRKPRGEGPGCIVLAPTRELAKQVSREMSYIGGGLGLSVECFYGGSSYTPQENALRRGVDVVVGTPGRIMDHMNKGALKLDNISFAVLDEADEMLSMGFAEDVEVVFQTLPPQDRRQVILFSATVPRWVKKLASQYQKKDVAIFDSVTSGSMAATTVRHCAVRVPERDETRASLLADIIAVHSCSSSEPSLGDGPSRAIVFTQTKKEADELATCGALDGCGAAVLHGDVSQRQRESTLAQFRQGRFQVLVATDVAARGLDISGVDVVVQYRVPRDSDAYIHRAGRTGRAGRSGTAVVMYSDRELRNLRDLEMDCRIKFEKESAPAPEMALEAAVDFAVQNSRTVDERVLKHLLPRAQAILNSPETAAATLAGILAVAGRRTKLEDRSVLSGERGMRTLLVKGRHAITPSIAMRCLSDLGQLAGEKQRVGLIRICQDGSAVVDVPSNGADAILEAAIEGSDLSVTAAVNVPPLREEDRRGGSRGSGRGRDRGGMGRQGGYSRGRDSYSSRGSYGSRGGGYGQRRSGGGGGYSSRDGGRRESYSRDGFSRNDGFSRHDGFSRNRESGGDYRRSSGGGGYGGGRDGGYSRRSSQQLQDDF